MNALSAFWLIAVCSTNVASVVAQETIYVGPTRAYTTIQAAADHAIANKEQDIATIINIDPGTYREFVDINTYTNWPSNDPDNDTPITFVGPGAVISGSDVFDQWVNVQGNRYEHVWLNDWGVGPDPTNGVNNVADIVRRRELVYVDGQRMVQVLTTGELANNTFFVDEPNDVIVLQTNMDVLNLTVEVGVRDRLYKQEWESNVTLDGLTFQHAATEWNDVDSAVKFNGAGNATVINCVLTENNSRGILFTSVDGVFIGNTTMNDNGWNGWATWRVKDFVARKTETSRNNWRGHQGAFYTWNVGNKLLATHGLDIRNHLAVDNFSRGLWLDLDNENVLMDSVIVSGNLSDGMFIEANQGPITIINSEFNNNGGEALLVANSDSVTLRNNEFLGNAKSWFRFTGSAGGRGVTDFETKERYTLFSENWVIRNNLIEVTDPSFSIFYNQILGSAFDRFVESLDADSNTYIHTGRLNAFHDRSNSNLTFDQWKAYSNVDENSTFTTHPYGTPTARFSFSLENLVAQFDASLSTDDGVLQYDWDFGDGQIDTGPTPSHAFAAEESYTVLLTVTDTASQADTVSQVINISLTEPPVASFTAAVTYLSAHLDGSESTDNNFVVGYEWFFGDDSTGAGAVIDHAYADSGNYAVKLVVTDNVGLTDTLIQVIRTDFNPPPIADFVFTIDNYTVNVDAASSSDDGTIQSYLWNFGDDSTGTGVTTAHVYDTTGTYQVELVVIDDGGLTDTLRQDIVIVIPNIAPTASFVFAVDSLIVNLDATASTDDGTVVSYLWRFGDDSTGTGMTTAHVYDTTGTYQVELVVIDDGGLTDTLRQDIDVVPPSADFSIKAFLTGPYVGAGQMSNYLAQAGMVPLTQPYADTTLVGSTKKYEGTETVTVLPYSDIVDWILVEVRTDTTAASTIARLAAFLRANGEIVDLDGSPVSIPWIVDGDYYIVLIHRNHVSVMSAAAVTVSSGLAAYDFTSGAGQAYGSASQLEVEPGVFAICSGDSDGDDSVGANDQILWLQQNGQAGYFNSDYNLSGGVTAQDNTIMALFTGHSSRVPD